MCASPFEKWLAQSQSPTKTCSLLCRSKISSARMAQTNRLFASKRMTERNPMRLDSAREKMSATLKAMKHTPKVRGGNGHGPTAAEHAIATAMGWPTNVVVKTHMPRGSGFPPAYKLDVGNQALKIGIEVDGFSHCARERQAQDAKKERFLRGLGWIVLRVSNRQALEELESTISRLRAAVPT